MKPAADVHVLYRSPIARVLDFHCRHSGDGAARPEYQPCHSVVFTRRGAYECRVGREIACIHSGLLLLDNPGSERRVQHYGSLRDECTDIEFSGELFQNAGRAARNRRFPRLTLPVTAELESLHALILAAARDAIVPALRVEVLLIDLLRCIQATLGAPATTPPPLDRKAREFYLANIDRAKSLMRTEFRENLSLTSLARAAGISVFHFSRVFKTFTGRAPHQYLLDLRLAHACALLRNTRRSVTEICFDSGFGSLEHFLATFRRRYGCTPRRYRQVATNDRALRSPSA